MDIEATMEHIAERQNKTEKTILQLGQSLLDIANAQERTNEILATLAERQVATEEALGRLAESQRTLAESQRTLAESQRALAEKQGTTEENLNVLLLTVERHISKHN